MKTDNRHANKLKLFTISDTTQRTQNTVLQNETGSKWKIFTFGSVKTTELQIDFRLLN